MNKYIIYIAALALATSTLTSCDSDDTEGMTGVTYYPSITLEGSTSMILNVGEEYVEPGFSAMLDGEDVTSQVQVTSDINTSEMGIYTVSYSMTNADGFTTSSSRTIYVTQREGVAGLYTTDSQSYRDYGGTVTNYGGYLVFVYDKGDGTYRTEDLLGGWYWQRAGYGTSYAMQGTFSVADDNTISLLESLVPGWGDSADYMTNGVYDPNGGTGYGSLSWTVSYVGESMFFNVVLNKI